MNHKRSLMTRSLLVLLLTCTVGSMACSSAGGGAAADAPAAPAAPAKKPFVAPEWESTEYRSDDGVFFVHYPSEFQEQPAQGQGAIFSAASPSMVPRVDITKIEDVGEASMEDIGASLAGNMAQLGGGEATIGGSEMVTLRDGVTQAMRFHLDWTFQGFPLDSVILVAPAEMYHVSVLVTGMDGADVAELDDIAYTLTLP